MPAVFLNIKILSNPPITLTHQTDVGIKAPLNVFPVELHPSGPDPQVDAGGGDQLRKGPAKASRHDLDLTFPGDPLHYEVERHHVGQVHRQFQELLTPGKKNDQKKCCFKNITLKNYGFFYRCQGEGLLFVVFNIEFLVGHGKECGQEEHLGQLA